MQGLPRLSELLARPISTGTVALAAVTTLLAHAGYDIESLYMSPQAVGSEPWRLVTSTLPHAGLMHFAFNAYWTLVLGGAIEARCGARVTGAVFLLTAIAASSLEYAFFRGGVGLSGVGYGLFGFTWIAARRKFEFTDLIDDRTVQTFVLWFVLCCVTTVTGLYPVANAAHAGGWIIGMLAGSAWAVRPRPSHWGMLITVLATGMCVGLASRPVRMLVNLGEMAQDLADEAYAVLEENPSKAAELYQAAIARKADVANWHYNRGVALERANQASSADAEYLVSYRLDARDPQYQAAVAAVYARRANAAQVIGDDATALRELERALAVAPTHAFSAEWRRYADTMRARIANQTDVRP